MTYFSRVRLYSAFEAVLFSCLLVVWIGGFDKHVQEILGWTHGIGWLILCVLVYRGARRGIFPWPLVAATFSPLGPYGSTIGFEVIVRRAAAYPETQCFHSTSQTR